MKRVLLFSHQYNLREINHYYALMMYHMREYLKIHFNTEDVDILPWKQLGEPGVLSTYDRVVMMEFALAPNFSSSHGRFLREFLRKYSGKKYCCSRDPLAERSSVTGLRPLIKPFYEGDICQEIENIRNNQLDVIFGSDKSLCLWTPFSDVGLKTDFNFPCELVREKATFYFENYEFAKKHHYQNLVDSLCYRIESLPANHKVFVLPCNQQELYVEEFCELLESKVSKVVDEVWEWKPVISTHAPYKYHIWDFETNSLKGDHSFEVVSK